MFSFVIQEKVWKYPGKGGWSFITLPKNISSEIRSMIPLLQVVGFGFIKIKATVGNSSWNTTLFPTKEGNYLLSLQSKIRKQEHIQEGDCISVTFELLTHL